MVNVFTYIKMKQMSSPNLYSCCPRVLEAIRGKIFRRFKHTVNVRAKKAFEVNDKMNNIGLKTLHCPLL